MLRLYGAMFIAIMLTLISSVGVYKAQGHSLSIYECANLHCPYTSEVAEDKYYVGLEWNGWVDLFASKADAVPEEELELQFMGINFDRRSKLVSLVIGVLAGLYRGDEC